MAKLAISLDRYSAISQEGVSIEFVDPDQKREGWKAVLTAPNAWVQYDRVDFGEGTLRAVDVNALSSTSGLLEIRIDRMDGPLVAQVEIPTGTDWKVADATLSDSPTGIHNLFVILKNAENVAVDWVQFK